MGKYRVLGSFLDRVFRNNLNANFDDVDADIQAQKKRVDDLIIANPSPSEVQDARLGFPVLRDKLIDVDEQLAEKVKKEDLFVNVKDFGAKGDGVTDDYLAIQNAIDSIGSGVVYFPKGTYLVSQAIKVNKSYVELRGMGIKLTTIKPFGTYAGALIWLGNDTTNTWTWGNSIKKMSVRESKAEGIKLKSSHQWIIEEVECIYNLGDGIYATWAWVGRLNKNILFDNDKNGFYADANCHAINITGNHFISNNQNGLYTPGRSSVTGNTFEKNTISDINITSKNSVSVSGNYFEGGRSGGDAILVDGSDSVSITANGLGAQPSGVKVLNSNNISVKHNNVGLSYASLLVNNYQTLNVGDNCTNIDIDQIGTVVISPSSINNVKFPVDKTHQDYLFPSGDFEKLVNSLPSGWDIASGGAGSVSTSLIPSITGETKQAIRLNVNVAHGSLGKYIYNLEPNEIYTVCACVSWKNVTTPTQFRFYGDPLTYRLSDPYYWSSTYNKGETVLALAFTVPANGTALIQMGSPTLGEFDIEWISLVKGNLNAQNFPRKKHRGLSNVIKSPNGSYYKLNVDDTGVMTTTLMS